MTNVAVAFWPAAIDPRLQTLSAPEERGEPWLRLIERRSTSPASVLVSKTFDAAPGPRLLTVRKMETSEPARTRAGELLTVIFRFDDALISNALLAPMCPGTS